jgi:hypothetical protein
MKTTLIFLLVAFLTSTIPAQTHAGPLLSAPAPKLSADQQVLLLCKLLESYKVDWTGYPERLEELVPTYIDAAGKANIEKFRYEPRDVRTDIPQAPRIFQRYRLVFAGADGAFGTSDDYTIDTLEVAKKPTGSTLPPTLLF